MEALLEGLPIAILRRGAYFTGVLDEFQDGVCIISLASLQLLEHLLAIEDEARSEYSEADDHDYYEGFNETGNQIVDKEDLEN